ncbi:MAG TPA: hypothetical protein VFG20_19375 [Planctomycetaceae bacterium]|nr:hypothetical protein [Planctomycetaceae bacterium]
MIITRIGGWRSYRLCLYLLLSPITVLAQESSGSIGDKAVAYLNAHLDQRVGGGSAWHMATETLRICGGEFIPDELGTDSPWDGDRVWGTLVARIGTAQSGGDSSPQSAALPGDVIQFRSAEFGTVVLPEVFTAVVAEVNEAGRPRSMFAQNYNRVRSVKKVDLDVTALTSGWMRIYRPKARIDRPDEWKFTVVNHRGAAQAYDVLVGIDIDSSNSIDKDNTYGSFRVHWLRTDGTVPNLWHYSGGSFFMETGKGYEIPSATDDSSFRQLAD